MNAFATALSFARIEAQRQAAADASIASSFDGSTWTLVVQLAIVAVCTYLLVARSERRRAGRGRLAPTGQTTTIVSSSGRRRTAAAGTTQSSAG